jgi:hypothetical protein
MGRITNPVESGRNRCGNVVETVLSQPEHGIGSDLPDQQRRRFVDDVGIEARQFVQRLLAADASVEYVDHSAVKTAPQGHLEPAGVRHDISLARRRRRADRNDLDLPLVFESLRQMRKRVFETNDIRMRIAGSWCHRHVNLRLREQSVAIVYLGAKCRSIANEIRSSIAK